MRTDFNGKSILITGGTGSIGSELLRQILSMDVERVIVFSRDEIKHFLLKKRIQDSRLKTIIGDVRDYKSLEGVFDEFDLDIIYHAAAMKHVVICEDNPVECIKTNILGTINLTDLARMHKISKMITISTDKSANPINIMGASKFIAERITLDANFSCVRFGNVANSRGSVIPVFLNSLIYKSAFEITDPSATRFIMEIPEAVELILNATHNCQGGDIFILKMRSFNLGDLLDVFIDRIAPGFGIPRKEIDIKITGLVRGEKLHEDLINESELSRTYELDNMYVVLKRNHDRYKYSNIKKTNILNYSSNHSEQISKEDLEKIIAKSIAHNLTMDHIKVQKISNEKE